MKTENLESIANKLVAPGKGILAADESSGTIEKRLKSINVPSTEENRRAYREILFTTAGAGEFISGVILFDETIRQKTRDGRTFVKALEEQEIIPGIKVDKGAKPMASFPGEKITEGLDGLGERLGVTLAGHQRLDLPPRAVARTDMIADVGPVEPGDDHPGLIGERDMTFTNAKSGADRTTSRR